MAPGTRPRFTWNIHCAGVAGSRLGRWRIWRYPGVDFSKIHRAEGTLFSSLYGTRRPENVFAHTSPAYAIVDGKPIRSWDDAQYYIGYMQHAIDWLRQEARFASAEDRKSSIAAFEHAKAVYEQRAREALAR